MRVYVHGRANVGVYERVNGGEKRMRMRERERERDGAMLGR